MQPILRPERNYWYQGPVSRAGILVDGDDYYRAFYEAGQSASSYILLAGWQFDTDACLLRGDDAKDAQLPVSLLAYLNALCERTPALRIYLLAWDFHVVFALEREWMQDLRFKWLTNDRVQFLFDGHHVEGGAHHQKFVVIDGKLSFLGGLDLCDHRWDNRRHLEPNPLRVSRGAPHRPFHDVQAYVAGTAVASQLRELFETRWRLAGGRPLELPAPPDDAGPFETYEPKGATPLDAERVALARVDPYGAPDGRGRCREITDLTLDAIGAAERLLYIETQYFSSLEIAEALCRRLKQFRTQPLDVVLVLNQHAETVKEEIALGLAQSRVIRELRAAAASTGNRLGLYYTVPCTGPDVEPTRGTYIHSKLLIADDRFMTVGSANLTNRSTCVDTELNLAVEAVSVEDRLVRSIRATRHGLLAEHLGVPALDAEGLVADLDERAREHRGRLRIHPSPTETELALLDIIDPFALPFDPGAPEATDRNLFIGGLGALWTLLRGTPDEVASR